MCGVGGGIHTSCITSIGVLHENGIPLNNYIATATRNLRIEFLVGTIAQQIVEAFPFDTAPRYLLQDRDSIYSEHFRRRVKSLGIEEVVTAPRSPWQSPYVERLIGSIRRECLNHVIVLNERHLRRRLRSYFTYYHDARTHLALATQCPSPRSINTPDQGRIISLPHVGGLHHEYRRAA